MSTDNSEIFIEFPKMARLSREIIITEKIDGTNAQVWIADDGVTMRTGSRTRWVTPENDNHGFAKWAEANRDDLLRLGPGRHFGEWWGRGIGRKYLIGEQRFSLFNVSRWDDTAVRPSCCHVVPTLYRGLFTTEDVEHTLATLAASGSVASPGFMRPEGVVVFHIAGNVGFKKTIEKDELSKWQREGGA